MFGTAISKDVDMSRDLDTCQGWLCLVAVY